MSSPNDGHISSILQPSTFDERPASSRLPSPNPGSSRQTSGLFHLPGATVHFEGKASSVGVKSKTSTKLVVCTAEGEVEKCEELDLEEPVLDEETKSKKDGWFAWLVCATSFLIQVLVVGILHAYGVFYVAFIEEFNASSAASAWIGAGAYGITMALAPVSSLIINRWGHRLSASTGCLLCGAGLAVSSFAENISSLYGSFMVLFALGSSLAYTPCMTIAGDYFDKYVTVATGIMTAGTSTGTLVLNPLAQALVNSIGWRNTLRVLTVNCGIGFLCALTFIPLTKTRKTPVQSMKQSRARDQMKSMQLWKNKVYIIWIGSIFCVMFGYYIPYVHLIAYANEVGVSSSKGSIILMTFGAATAVGRVGFGKIVTLGYLDHLHMDQLTMTVTGAAVMILPLIKNFAGLMVYVIIVGLVDGCYVVLLPTMTTAFCGDEQRVIGWGFLNLLCSVTFTLGPPVAGWIKDATGDYSIAFHVAGVPIILGAILLFFIPWAQKTAKSVDVKILAAAESFHDISVITLDVNKSSTDEREQRPESDPIKITSQLDRGLVSLLPDDGTEVVTVQAGGSTMLFDLARHRVSVYSSTQPEHTGDVMEQMHGSLRKALELVREPQVRTSVSGLAQQQSSILPASDVRHILYPGNDHHSYVSHRHPNSGMAIASPHSIRLRLHSTSEFDNNFPHSVPEHSTGIVTTSENKIHGFDIQEKGRDVELGHEKDRGSRSRQLASGTPLPTITEITDNRSAYAVPGTSIVKSSENKIRGFDLPEKGRDGEQGHERGSRSRQLLSSTPLPTITELTQSQRELLAKSSGGLDGDSSRYLGDVEDDLTVEPVPTEFLAAKNKEPTSLAEAAFRLSDTDLDDSPGTSTNKDESTA